MRRHYRFVHVRETAEDPVDLIVAHYVTDAPAWDCGVCAEPNEGDDRFCWWCRAEHGDWLCDCGRRNRKADEECSECGTPQPDAE